VAAGAVVSGAASAVVDEALHAERINDEPRMMVEPTTANRILRLMTTHSSRNRGSRNAFFRTLA
jgi:hypothetical protein